jgi:hypothetical protein
VKVALKRKYGIFWEALVSAVSAYILCVARFFAVELEIFKSFSPLNTVLGRASKQNQAF